MISLRKFVFFHLPAFILVICLAFLFLQSSPGNPAAAARLDSGDSPQITGKESIEIENAWMVRHGMDIPAFYFSVTSWSKEPTSILHWLPDVSFHSDNRFQRWLFGHGENSSGILQGDFGYSYRNQEPVSDIIRPRILNTALLSLSSLLIALMASIPLGLRAAGQSRSRLSRFMDAASLLLLSIPVFWTATLLAMTFADQRALGWFPSPGSWPVDTLSADSYFSHWILPVITFSLAPCAFLFRWVRQSASRELEKEYVQTAKAKGAGEKAILYGHVFRNLVPELIAILGQLLPIVLSGSILIETVFVIPGMGFTIFQAATTKDIPLLSATFLLYASIAMATYAFTDLLTIRLDPRRKPVSLTN